MIASNGNVKYRDTQLVNFAKEVLVAAGLEASKSEVVAATLVEADLLGHTTHGLQFLPSYVKELETEGMTACGDVEVIKDFGSAITWDGDYLPGPWLVHQAIDLALERVQEHPVVTIVIRKSHHIGCLAAYLEKVATRGYLLLLSCSDPKNKTVAPFGGTTGVYSPNPLAAGIPAESQPILLDVSMSATANAFVKRAADSGDSLPHPWLLTADGEVTDNPATFFNDPPSTILPLGNLDTGHKGFALGLLVEALTNGLGGYGRYDEPNKWTASVFIQILNPEAFGGTNAFTRETQYLSDACKSSSSLAVGGVRMPGERALQLKRVQKEEGVLLSQTIVSQLEALSKQYQVKLPTAID